MLVLNLSIFFWCIFLYSNGTSWSNWTRCSPLEDCHQKSLLKCYKGKKIQCAPAQRNDYLYQTTISSDCNETCNGHSKQDWKTNTQVRTVDTKITHK